MWIEQNGVNPADIKLLRHNGTAWEILPTTMESTTTGYVIFEARTPGLSSFAITAEKVLSSPATGVTDSESHVTGSDVGMENKQSEKSKIWTLAIGIFLVGVCAAGYTYMKRQ